MPVHDWTKVDAGLFHAHHHNWITELARALNQGILPSDYFALPEQNIRGPIPDVLTLKLSAADGDNGVNSGGAVATQTPRTCLTQRAEMNSYLRKAKRISVRHRHGDVVAVIEIISPGNKASRAELRSLVEKSVDLLRQGVHLLVIDLFPPGKRDPQGIHKAIWDEFEEADVELPADKPLTLASYEAATDCVAHVEFVGFGEMMPDMPLYLQPEKYVRAPLEQTYQAAWAEFPTALKGLLESK